MFYEPGVSAHGLPHDPFKAIVAPRPIGWISSKSEDDVVNLAPYSFFNAISSVPPMVMFSSVGWKDSARNIRETGEFVCNYAGERHQDAMNKTSIDAPRDIDEGGFAGLQYSPSKMVNVPRVKDVWAALECRMTQIIEPHDLEEVATGNVVIFGQVIGIYISDEALVDGAFEVEITKPVTRGGYLDFGRRGEKFQMPRPVWDEQ